MTATSDRPWQDLDQLEPFVRSFLRPRVRDENDLEDVVQEALLRAARYRSLEGEPERLRPWILRVAENALCDHRRRHLRLPMRGVATEFFDDLEGREETPGDEPEQARIVLADQPFERHWLLSCVGRALRDLDLEDQDVLDVFYGGAGGCREVAREMDLDPLLVKSRLHRARRRLSVLVRRRLAPQAAPAAQRRASDPGRGATCPAARRPRNGDGRAVTKGIT